MRVIWGGKIKNEKEKDVETIRYCVVSISVDIQLGCGGKPKIQVHKYPKVLSKYYSVK